MPHPEDPTQPLAQSRQSSPAGTPATRSLAADNWSTSVWSGSGPEAAAAGEFRAASLAGYELLDQLGAGGMGVVFRARQLAANRLVALKLIRQDVLACFTPRQRDLFLERFRTEAQATAQLHSPSIVTVYEVGEQHGQPFYSMRLVQGRSLAEHLRLQPLENRRAARYLLQAAEALQQAHERKILHRDLKPANILIDEESDRAVVSDFGLAKLLEGSQEMTSAGDVLGSPPYMAPEQADAPETANHAADVYGLGATLYHCLTGRPPFQAATAMQTLRQAAKDEPVPPSRLNSGVDRDLETICLKCLQKEPAQRYESAGALADDLQRYLDDRPIMARPLGRWGRIRKWIRRNPLAAAATGATLAAVILLIVGLTSAYLLTSQALVRTEEARQRESRANQTALRRLDLARNAFNDFFLRIAKDPRLKVATLASFRRDLLEKTREYSRQIVAENPEDEASQLARSEALTSLAEILVELNELQEGLVLIDAALDSLEPLRRKRPDQLSPLLGVVQARMRRMRWLTSVDQQRALADLDRLEGELNELRGHPSQPYVRRLECSALREMGLVLVEAIQPERGRELLEQALAGTEKLLPGAPDAADVQSLLSDILFSLATSYRWRGQWPQVEDYAQRALESQRKYLSSVDDYRVLAAQLQEAIVLHVLGQAMLMQGKLQGALEHAAASHDRLGRLASQHPDVPIYGEQRAISSLLAGNAAAQLSRADEAKGFYREAIEELREAAFNGELPELAIRFAEAATQLASLDLEDVRQAPPGALQDVLVVLDEAGQALQSHSWTGPRRIEAAIYSVRAASIAGWALFGTQRYQEAVGRFDKALQENQKLAVMVPRDLFSCQMGRLQCLARIPARCREALAEIERLQADPEAREAVLFNGAAVLAAVSRTAARAAGDASPAEASENVTDAPQPPSTGSVEDWRRLSQAALETGLAGLQTLHEEGRLAAKLPSLRDDPAFDPYRGDPRFQNLLRKHAESDSGR